MFTDQLCYYEGIKSPRIFVSQKKNKKSSSLDFQYQICNTFLKHTGERLHSKEAELIFQTNDFFMNLEKNMMNIDKNVTLQTASESVLLNPESASQSDEQKYGSINRKKLNKMTSKRQQENANEALQDIKVNCSMITYKILDGIIGQYRKLQNRIKNIQSRQNLNVKREQKADRYHEQNIILRTKLETQNKEISFLNKELHLLKQKNKQILDSVNEKIEQMKQSYKYQELNNKVYRDIKAFLGDKQVYVNSRIQKIQCIESSLMQNIEKAINFSIENEQACQRCCQIMKKIKTSIFNYKGYLQEQAEEMEKLYLKHKKSLFVNKCPSLT